MMTPAMTALLSSTNLMTAHTTAAAHSRPKNASTMTPILSAVRPCAPIRSQQSRGKRFTGDGEGVYRGVLFTNHCYGLEHHRCQLHLFAKVGHEKAGNAEEGGAAAHGCYNVGWMVSVSPQMAMGLA